jgi:hypothetical protein
MTLHSQPSLLFSAGMKAQRAKRNSERPAQAAGKSVYQLYRELLFLREEVRAAEQRAIRPRRKLPKARDKRAYDA